MNQKKIVGFLAYWVANSVVLLVAALIFQGNVVLGNKDIGGPAAAVLCGLIISVLTLLVEPLVAKSRIKESFKSLKIKDENLNGLAYLIANIALVWVLKWFASVLGLGISSVFYAILVGVILTVGQWAVYKFVPNANGKK